MSRSGKTHKRASQPDVLHSNRTLGRFINHVMKHGKKTVAQNVVYKALERLQEKGQEPIKVFETALNNVGPKMEVKHRRVGGASYQVPMEVRGERKMSLAIRWILDAARKRSSKEYHSFDEKLAAELLDASQNLGEAIRRRDVVHKMAESNRAFAHFKW